MPRLTAAEVRAALVLQGAPLDRVDQLAPAPRPRKRRTGRTPEGHVLGECLAYLKHHPRVAWAHRINTGLAYLPGRGGQPQPVRFGFPGCSDILGQLRDGRMLAVECKAPGGGNCTEEQAAFLSLVAANGGAAFVARCVADLKTGALAD